jgi:hypothetical protein
MNRTEELDKRALVAANYHGDFRFQTHRGVITEDGYLIAFGNDGYGKDKRSKAEVDNLLNCLTGDYEYGYAVEDGDGYSWALVIEDFGRKIDEHGWNEMLWRIWFKVCEGN